MAWCPLPRAVLLLVFVIAVAAAADDVKRDDVRAPKSESCDNPFQLVISPFYFLRLDLPAPPLSKQLCLSFFIYGLSSRFDTILCNL